LFNTVNELVAAGLAAVLVHHAHRARDDELLDGVVTERGMLDEGEIAVLAEQFEEAAGWDRADASRESE
jgi:DNA-binding SARP family transcriptional activator